MGQTLGASPQARYRSGPEFHGERMPCESNRNVRQYKRERQRVSSQDESRRQAEETDVPLSTGARLGQPRGTLYIGDRFTIVKDLKKELGPGLLSDMVNQLGIRKEDL